MKKRKVFGVLIISILLIGVISVSLVSAGLIEDFWSKITGRVVDNETEVEENDEEESSCAASITIDFDKTSYSKGDLIEITIEVFDSQGNHLSNYDFYIKMYDNMWHSASLQKTGSDGYFKSSETAQNPAGWVTTVKFKVYTKESGSCGVVEDIGEFEFIYREREEEAEPEPRPEPEPEPAPTVCAAEIKIAFDKSVYYMGNVAKIVIEVLDSQGNRLPNYLFYGRTCDDQTGECTNIDSARTDADGYLKAEGELEGEEGIGRSEVWIEAIGTCPAIPVTMVKFEVKKEKSEPVPCGIGTCIPEEEEEPKEIPEDKVFYKCNGCELEEKCYPMGYRKEGQYCSDNYEFISQIDGGCDNDFECKSNVCISDECVEEGLMRKIIKWFKKLFGIKPKPPEAVTCSELLIEEDIGDYEYDQSSYGGFKEAQAPVISDEGEQTGTIKCCVAQYLKDERRGMALVCPYENREYVENVVTIGLEQASEGGANFILEDYKGESVYVDKWVSMVWTHENYAIASGTDYKEEGHVFPEEIADAYLEKYPNDIEEIIG